jgi:hypothetical protein
LVGEQLLEHGALILIQESALLGLQELIVFGYASLQLLLPKYLFFMGLKDPLNI